MKYCVSGLVVCADDTASETQLKLSRQVHETICFHYMKTHNGRAINLLHIHIQTERTQTHVHVLVRECCGVGVVCARALFFTSSLALFILYG